MKYSKNKVLGMLLGSHCGDSLGATLEFKDEDPDFKHKNIIGGGVFNWQAGDATDDTDLTIIVLKSIKNGNFSEETCKRELINWLQTNPIDVGTTTRRSIEQLAQNRTPIAYEEGQGNGSIMRASPLALLNKKDSDVNDIVRIQCSLTHPHSNCILVDQIYIQLLKMALRDDSKQDIYNKALDLSKNHLILHNKIKKIPSITWEDLKTSGYSLDSLVCSIWALYHFDSFEEALIQIVNKGDDADTSGAIAGALCGAWYGLDNIPQRWLKKIKKKDLIEELAQEFISD